MQPLRHSRNVRTSALLLLGATALGLGLTHRVSAQETVGGGSLVSPAVGPPPAFVPPTLTGVPLTLVKNWHFGTGTGGTTPTIKSYDDMSKEFFYHDPYGNTSNGGQYGGVSAAPDQQNSVKGSDSGGQPVEGTSISMYDGVILPPVRTFEPDSLQTYLQPRSSSATVQASAHNVVSGSFTAKWKLPSGGALLGQDIVWETRVRYVTAPEFWFSLWTGGSSRADVRSTTIGGAEADVVESYGERYDNEGALVTYGNDNYDGHLWHSNMVGGGTDGFDYYYNGGYWGGEMTRVGYDSLVADMGTSAYNPYKASDYHIWTWVYHKNDTYEMYVDGKLAQQNIAGTTYPWTAGAQKPQPTLDGPLYGRPLAAPIDLNFLFDFTWGNNSIARDNGYQQLNQPMDASLLGQPSMPGAPANVYYDVNYSRVYLSGGAEAPYKAATSTVPSTIASSDYDTGGDGGGYHLYAGPLASSSVYRADNNGNIVPAPTPDANNDKDMLANNAPHDWYKYTVNVPYPVTDTAVLFTAAFQVSSQGPGGTFHLEDEKGNDLTGSISVPDTGGAANWTTVSASTAPFALHPEFPLSTGPNPGDGVHTLRLVMDTVGSSGSVGNFGSMQIAYATVSPTSGLANGSFETPTLGAYNEVNSVYIFNPANTDAIWNFSGNAGIENSVPTGNNYLPDGVQMAFLAGSEGITSGTSTNSKTGGTLGSISQTLYLAPGNYTLTYNSSGHWYDSGSQAVQVLLDTTQLDQPVPVHNGTFYSQPGPPPVQSSLYTTSVSFTVGNGSYSPGLHTIRLQATVPLPFTANVDNVKLAFAPAAPTGPTITQGSFEYPRVLIPNDATLIPSSDSRLASSGWNFAGGSGITITNGKYGNPACPDGTQAALLYSGGSVSQTVSFPKDGYYSITFLAADAYYENPGHPLQVLVDGNLAGTVSPVPNVFGSSTFSFPIVTGTPNAPSNHTIAFQGANDGNTGYNTFVDKVSLTTAAATVVTQGSFEYPQVLGSDPTYISSGDPRLNTSGWSFAGVSGIIQTSGKLGNPNSSPDGSQVAYVEPGGTVSQSIPFATGGYYTLTLQEAEIYYDSLQTDGTTHAVQVLVDGALAGTFNPGRGGYSQGTFLLGFLAAGSHTIQLQGSSTDGSWFRDFIDSVAIAPAAGPMAGAVFSNSGAAQATHLASFGRITPLTASAYRALAAAAPANPPSAAFDTKVGTFFDYAQSSGGYVGLTLTSARSVSKIRYAPRVGYEKRMVGGVFEGSNTSATTGYTTLATVTATPKDGTGNTLPVTNHTAFKWLRYRGPTSGYCDVAEIQLLH